MCQTCVRECVCDVVCVCVIVRAFACVRACVRARARVRESTIVGRNKRQPALVVQPLVVHSALVIHNLRVEAPCMHGVVTDARRPALGSCPRF